MRFINPKTDFAFKRIFGSEQSHEVLIDFLDAVLYGSRGVIADLEILNPWLAPRIRGMKDTYLDVRARLTEGQVVIIEMQVGPLCRPCGRRLTWPIRSTWSRRNWKTWNGGKSSSPISVMPRARRNDRAMPRVTEGHAEGHAEGQRQKALSIARALLDVLDLDTIAAKTGPNVGKLWQLRSQT